MESAKLFFRENPFPATPSPDRYVAVGSTEQARVRLLEAIDRREGPALIVGPAGTGKTLLCQLIANTYRTRFDVAFLSETRICTRKALLQHLLHHLGLPYSDRSEGELRLALIDRAATGGPDSRAGVLIVVDEAHTLPSRLLEELRMMSGIVRNGSPRVQLVLAGGPSLDERLSQPRMEALSQRIGARCYLHPLGQRETSDYVRESIRRVGANPERCIEETACQAVYYASNGIPRLINQTLSRAFAIAESIGRDRMTGELVERAWADLQQLPSPLCDSEDTKTQYQPISQASSDASSTSTSILEFGELGSDEGDLSTHSTSAPIGAARQSDPMAETTDYVPANTNLAPIQIQPINGCDAEGDVDEEVDEELTEDVYANTDIGSLFGDDFEEEQVITFNRSASTSDSFATSNQTIDTVQTVVDAASTPSKASFNADISNGTPNDLESTLHDEIISINCEAIGGSLEAFQQLATAQFEDTDVQQFHAYGEDLASHVTNDELSHENDEPQSIAAIESDFDEEFEISERSLDEILELNDADHPVLPFSIKKEIDSSIDEYEDMIIEEYPSSSDELEAAESNRYSDITVSDDSDMLIIEEDLDIESLSTGLSPRAPRSNDADADDANFQEILARLREG